jgi:arabinogalactan endo-1,4-beta-galactosidase
VAQVPGGLGLGVFYWEPEWYAVKGAGWQTGAGNEWDNQAVFDPQGNAMQSSWVFRLARPGNGRASIPATITGLVPIEMEVPIKSIPELPPTVKATYTDDSVRAIAVTWEMPGLAAFSKAGRLTVTGKVAGTTITAKAELTVSSEINYAKNPGWENGLMGPWTVTGDTSAVNVSNETGNPHSGTFALHYWLDKPFAATVSQTVVGLPAGTYSLSAWFQGVGGEKVLQLYVTCGGVTKFLAVVNSGWQQWSTPRIDGIAVSGGTCTIGVKIDADTGIWGFVDDIKLVRAG